MGIGMGLLTVWWERHHQGTQGEGFKIGAVERVLIASRALWFYAGKLLWPSPLIFSYPRWKISASDLGAYLWVVATAALGMLIWRVRRWTGRSVEVAAVYYAATLSPVLGFIMLYTFLYSFVADHYQYLACIGPLALAAAGMKMGLGRVLQPVLGAVLLIVLGILTWQQCEMYANAETLWQTTLRQNPNSWLAHNNLGTGLRQKGSVDEAIMHYQEALKIMPANESVHFNLARAFLQKGEISRAIAHFQSALEIEPADMEAQNNLAWLLATSAQPSLRNGEKAVQLARQANELAGGKNPVVVGTLAAALAETGRFADAVQKAQEAVALARAAGRQDLAAKLDRELQSYKAGLSWHQ
jgi:tetratricopeptide (TPR) repeat protein